MTAGRSATGRLDDDFTPEQLAVLRAAADNYLGGRRLACLAFRAVVALGAVAAAIAGMLALVRTVGGRS